MRTRLWDNLILATPPATPTGSGLSSGKSPSAAQSHAEGWDFHKDQYAAYILQVLHVEMSKSELHTTVDARKRTIQLVMKYKQVIDQIF